MAHSYRKHPASAAARERYREAARFRARLRNQSPPRVIPAAPDPADLSAEAWERRGQVSAAIRAQAAAGVSAANLDLFPDDAPAASPAPLDLFAGGA